MREERGLSEATIRNRCWHVEKLLVWFMRQNRSLAEVSLCDVDAFLNSKGSQDWGRVSVATCANALRSFFRHAEMRGWCVPGIAAGISGPRLFKHEALPVGPAWADVQQLINGSNGDKPRDIRDRAILMLFAIYGFRSAEVAGLRLEEVNWERDIIMISRPKQRRAQGFKQQPSLRINVRPAFGHQFQIVVRRPQAVFDFRAPGKSCGADRISKCVHERPQALLLRFVAGSVQFFLGHRHRAPGHAPPTHRF